MLTSDEINLLIEALETWESEGGIEAALIATLMTRDKPEREAEAFIEERHREFKGQQRLKKERSIMLKAKLLQLRDKAEVEELVEEL